MSDLDEEFSQLIADIEELKASLAEDEQNVVDAWIAKLQEVENDEDKEIRNEYANYLKTQLNGDDLHLSVPFLENPPEDSLPPLQKLLQQYAKPDTVVTAAPPKEHRRYFCSATAKECKVPCRSKSVGRKPPERTYDNSPKNEFEDTAEMAKVIARSKGMSLAEFVADISRHTSDNGHEMRIAMKTETSSFSECVERILNQRVRDLAELLDDKQHYELLRIQKDRDDWLSELSRCKRRIKEMIPDFDLDLYRRDKNYLKKVFTVKKSSPPSEDKFKEWKDENSHRIAWFAGEIQKLSEENDQVLKEMSDIKMKTLDFEQRESRKQQCHANNMQAEREKYNRLKQKSDKLGAEITELLLSLEK